MPSKNTSADNDDLYFTARVIVLSKYITKRVAVVRDTAMEVDALELEVRIVDKQGTIVQSLPPFIVWSFGKQRERVANITNVHNTYSIRFHKQTFNIYSVFPM